jgi:hypothetical protein
VGLGVALAFPVALFVMLPAAWRQPWVRAAYLALPMLTIVLYVALRRLYPLFFEPLSFEEQVAQPAGLHALPTVLAGVWNLVCFAASEFPRGFFWAGRRYPDGASSIVLALVGASLAVLAWRSSSATRRAALALASLSFGIYFAIALGRTGLFPLPMMATQTRYHDVAAIPIVTLICMALQEIGRIGPLRRVPRGPLLLAALALFAWGRTRSSFHIELNAWPRLTIQNALTTIAAQVSRSPPGETAYLENGVNSKVILGPDPDISFPGLAAIFLITHEDDQLDGRTVRFVERNPDILARYRRRPESRLARLLVPPDAAKRGS